MTITRIYHDGDISLQEIVVLNISASRHLLRVLRHKINDPLIVFNGKGGEFQARIQSIEKGSAAVEITNYQKPPVESSLSIHLGQGISRGERMDYVIQKSVELGVNKITPLFTERCGVKISEERLTKRRKHWQSVAIAACEQSRRCVIPQIMTPTTLSDWLSKPHSFGFVCDPNAQCAMDKYSEPKEALSALIGPEGGLSTAEIEQALTYNFHALSLGPRILRTETATVVALAVIQHQWGDI